MNSTANLANLRSTMYSTGVTLEDVAARAGRSVSYVSKQLSGHIALKREVADAVRELVWEAANYIIALQQATKVLNSLAEVAEGNRRSDLQVMAQACQRAIRLAHGEDAREDRRRIRPEATTAAHAEKHKQGK